MMYLTAPLDDIRADRATAGDGFRGPQPLLPVHVICLPLHKRFLHSQKLVVDGVVVRRFLEKGI